MWQKIKKFIVDNLNNELYVKDEKKILDLYRALQTINIVVFFLILFIGFLGALEGGNFAIFLLTILVAALYLLISKIFLDISFGWLYDLRVLRMNSEKNNISLSIPSEIEETKDSE